MAESSQVDEACTRIENGGNDPCDIELIVKSLFKRKLLYSNKEKEDAVKRQAREAKRKKREAKREAAREAKREAKRKAARESKREAKREAKRESKRQNRVLDRSQIDGVKRKGGKLGGAKKRIRVPDRKKNRHTYSNAMKRLEKLGLCRSPGISRVCRGDLKVLILPLYEGKCCDGCLVHDGDESPVANLKGLTSIISAQWVRVKYKPKEVLRCEVGRVRAMNRAYCRYVDASGRPTHSCELAKHDLFPGSGNDCAEDRLKWRLEEVGERVVLSKCAWGVPSCEQRNFALCVVYTGDLEFASKHGDMNIFGDVHEYYSPVHKV